MKLEIELVPKTSWFSNLRSEVTKKDWEAIKKLTFSAANYRCEICNGVGAKHPVECHEVWEYKEPENIQKLVRTISLCPKCHMCKHVGFHMNRSPRTVERVIIPHLRKVNNISKKEAEDMIMEAFRLWNYRSKKNWTLDISWLKNKFPNMKIKGEL